MIVKVKFVNDKAKELYRKASEGKSIFPFKKHNEDFCYDVVATSCEEVAPNVYQYGVGLAFQIARGNEKITSVTKNAFTAIDLGYSPLNLSIDLRPRSSVSKTGMVLANCTGTVDETYTGEVKATFYHLIPDMPIYKVGERIGQIKVGTTFPLKFVEVDELNVTARADGGFGSTGK